MTNSIDTYVIPSLCAEHRNTAETCYRIFKLLPPEQATKFIKDYISQLHLIDVLLDELPIDHVQEIAYFLSTVKPQTINYTLIIEIAERNPTRIFKNLKDLYKK